MQNLKLRAADWDAIERELCSRSLSAFIKRAWHVIEPGTPYTHNWHIDAICEHLEAITNEELTDDGESPRLLVNVPPGMMKSLIVNVFWPSWEWGPRSMPYLRYVCASHSETLSIRDSTKMRRLITSDWYQSLWGDRVKIVGDQNEKRKFENTATGFRQAIAAGGITGARGNRVLVDDPHSVNSASSDAERASTIEWFLEAIPTRLDNPIKSAIVVIMQRLHEEDVSGTILAKDLGYEHLCLPMEFEPDRRCVTGIGFVDPRTEEGELLFPERFPRSVVERDKASLGSYASAGQFQQRPEPRGGGILKREHWSLWDDDAARMNGVSAGKYPAFEYLLASLDTAYTEKQENDPSALTVWGVWLDGRRRKRVMLVSAWAEHLDLNALVTKTAETCKRFKVDKLLVEAKASGISVAQEIRRLHSREDWSVQLVNPGAQDKVARAYQVQPLFETGMIYAPDRAWADAVIGECATFPRGKHDDRVDSTTQALSFLRSSGLLVFDTEAQHDIDADMMHRGGAPSPLYPA